MTIKPENLIAVGSDIEHAGASVFWNMHGDIAIDTFRRKLAEAGVDPSEAPPVPTHEQALRRAMRSERDRKGDVKTLVRPLKKAASWMLVTESVGENKLNYSNEVKVFLDEVGRLRIDSPYPMYDLEDRVKTNFDWAQESYTARRVSSWLRHRVFECSGVALRDNGGFYFIPHHGLARFRKYAAAAGALGKVYFMSTMQNDKEALEAVLDSMTAEAKQVIDEMTAELDKEALGKRAVRTRQDRCDDLRFKVQRYEELLGTKMATLQLAIKGLERKLTEAELMLDDDEN